MKLLKEELNLRRKEKLRWQKEAAAGKIRLNPGDEGPIDLHKTSKNHKTKG